MASSTCCQHGIIVTSGVGMAVVRIYVLQNITV
jgi:hypothetical protein